MHLIAGDVISQQFESFLFKEAKDVNFMTFSPQDQGSRVDVFLHQHISAGYPELWSFCKKLLLLSHGQAEVDRGFSINKEVETCNISEDTIIAQRLVCDHVKLYGTVTRVPLTKELLNYCATARTRYRAYLDEERKTNEKDEQKLKRRRTEECLDELKKKRKCAEDVCESLRKEADTLAEQAENTAGTKMATLIAKSNALRRRAKEKKEEMLVIDDDIEKKSAELRHIQ